MFGQLLLASILSVSKNQRTTASVQLTNVLMYGKITETVFEERLFNNMGLIGCFFDKLRLVSSYPNVGKVNFHRNWRMKRLSVSGKYKLPGKADLRES